MWKRLPPSPHFVPRPQTRLSVSLRGFERREKASLSLAALRSQLHATALVSATETHSRQRHRWYYLASLTAFASVMSVVGITTNCQVGEAKVCFMIESCRSNLRK